MRFKCGCNEPYKTYVVTREDIDPAEGVVYVDLKGVDSGDVIEGVLADRLEVDNGVDLKYELLIP